MKFVRRNSQIVQTQSVNLFFLLSFIIILTRILFVYFFPLLSLSFSFLLVFVCLHTVQHECIPQAVLGMDILCQAKSGMGKTAVFVLATLQQLEPTENHTYVLVMCHTRELAFQISKEYERFSKYMPAMKVAVFFGGLPIQKDEETLKTMTPHIVVGTPGRILALIRNKKLNFKHLKHFILDECDKMLEQLGELAHDHFMQHNTFY